MKSLVRKVAAGVLAAATMLGVAGLGATTASAEDATGKLTVTSSDAAFNGKTVKAYQMFSASRMPKARTPPTRWPPPGTISSRLMRMSSVSRM